jgi:hypothetical protein
MLKRPLNSRFTLAVLDGRKFTTIRQKPWPVGSPIMLYNWSGAAYRSKQADVAPVIVKGVWPITIAQTENGEMRYDYGMAHGKPLWETEGFESREAMDEWFRAVVRPGQSVTRWLMRFSLANE